jgi:hypothetical protein
MYGFDSYMCKTTLGTKQTCWMIYTWSWLLNDLDRQMIEFAYIFLNLFFFIKIIHIWTKTTNVTRQAYYNFKKGYIFCFLFKDFLNHLFAYRKSKKCWVLPRLPVALVGMYYYYVVSTKIRIISHSPWVRRGLNT